MNTKPALDEIRYMLFKDLILERTGMLFSPRRRDALARGVTVAAEQAGHKNLSEYHGLLQDAETDSELWDDLIGTITVNETYFFRNSSHIKALRKHILPELIQRHQNDRRLRIWSTGCASGEEPYTIAILLDQLLPEIADWNISILATDINRKVLQYANKGQYRKWSLRQTDPDIQKEYFTPHRGGFNINSSAREMVSYAYLNLVEDSYPSLATNTNAMDLILYRNVAIYLPEAVIRDIAVRLHRCLLPEGWLVVGASETNSLVYNMFAVRNLAGATIYQKTKRRETRVAPRNIPRERRKKKDRSKFGQRINFPITPASEAPRPHFRITSQTHPPVPRSPADPYQEGLTLFSQGQYEEASTCFLKYIEREPDSALAHYQMARTRANQNKLEEAQSWCQTALEHDQLMVEAHYTLAIIYQEQGLSEQAVAQLKKVIYLDPGFVLAHFSLSNIYQGAGQRDSAARHQVQAIRLAIKLPSEEELPCSDGLTAARLVTMIKAMMN